MRILLITNVFPNPYQPSRGVFNLKLAQALAGEHDVRVISPTSWIEEWWKNGRAERVMEPGREAVMGGIQSYYPRFYYSPKLWRHKYGWFLWRSVKKTVRRVLGSFSPDVVMGYWAHPDGEVAVRVARMIGVPSVVMVGGSDVLILTQTVSRRRCILNVLERADGLVVVSRDLRAKLVDFGIDPGKIHVVLRGVDQGMFTPGDRAQARRNLRLPTDENMLLWVGRMVPVKGLDVLLAACSELRNRKVDFQLHLVGDGPLRDALTREARSRGLAGNITFAGAVTHEHLPDWYRAADLTVLPSRSEGIPNVLRESLACGTPFVASRVGGIPELANGVANRLVPPGDAIGLADGIAAALADPESAAMTQDRPASWSESGEALIRAVRPLVAGSQDPDQPWWVDDSPHPPARSGMRRLLGRWRQLVRNSVGTKMPHALLTIRGPKSSAAVCLTFDDGPHPEHTPRLLDVLRDQGIKATFFMVGRLAERYPDIVRRVAAEGHRVGNHSYFHPRPDYTSTAQLLDGIQRSNELFTRLTGAPTPLFRPPNGRVTAWSLYRLWSAGQTVVLWNVDPKDYLCKKSAEVRGFFQDRPPAGGDLVLMHDRLPHAHDILPDLVAGCRDRGLDFTTVDQWTR